MNSVAHTQPVSPPFWWTVQASAPLQAVATQNLACFGRGGVPHYPVSPDAIPPTPGPPTVCTEVIACPPADQPVKLASLDAELALLLQETQQVIWSGYDTAQHMQINWVWDFYRIMSHVVLRVAAPAPDVEPDAAWQSALDGIRALVPGDVIVCDVRSACGDIHQEQPVAAPAAKWEPAR